MANILVIGSGGREHALAWKLKQSPKVGKIFAAPGNGGSSLLAENVEIKATDVLALADWAENNKIDFTVVGPDDALALGIVDEFQKRGLKIWGPGKAAAKIESSKAFAKKLMEENDIPTAEFKVFNDYGQALLYVQSHFQGSVPIAYQSMGQAYGRPSSPINGHATRPVVIKASGLALGKGVAVCETLDEAKNFLQDVMVNKIFGDSGSEVVIEEFLQGREFSVHAFCDGKNFKLFPSAQDHKTIYDNDQGPNTGGMGAIAPVPWVTNDLMKQVSSEIVKPALEGLKNLGSPFVGLLYPGLMAITADKSANYAAFVVSPFMGSIKIIEFNARFGDPETQSYMRLLKTDLYDILEACVNGSLDKINIEWSKKSACCIVLASGGYPGEYKKGLPITGIADAEKMDDIIIFHAGTAIKDGQLVTNGGRVLGVTAIADDLQTALNKAYTAIKLINFKGMRYRSDIGQKTLTYV